VTLKRSMPAAALTALALIGLTACDRGAAGGDEDRSQGPVKVTLITDSSGAVASYGKANVNAVRMAVDELNGEGGVDGRKIELLVRDSKVTPETGVQLARHAVLRSKVSAIFGPVSSGVAVAMTDVAKQFKTPIWALYRNWRRSCRF
jgi:branched-chain amino acid transport system substrate-binding protein